MTPEDLDRILDMNPEQINQELMNLGYDPDKVGENVKLSPFAIKVISALHKRIEVLEGRLKSPATDIIVSENMMPDLPDNNEDQEFMIKNISPKYREIARLVIIEYKIFLQSHFFRSICSKLDVNNQQPSERGDAVDFKAENERNNNQT